MELTPIRARSVCDAVYEQLRDAILSGRVSAGYVLPGERKLCEALEVNRGALREALKRLDQDQLIQIQQGEGTRVRDFRQSARVDLLVRLVRMPSGELDPAVLRSVAELRLVLTPDISRLAALRRTADDVAHLKHALEHLRATVDVMPGFQQSTEDYWATLTQASQNVAYRLLNNTIRQVHLEVSHCLGKILDTEHSEYKNLDRYAEIAAAVEHGDAGRAETLARLHAEAMTRALGLKENPPAV